MQSRNALPSQNSLVSTPTTVDSILSTLFRIEAFPEVSAISSSDLRLEQRVRKTELQDPKEMKLCQVRHPYSHNVITE